MTTHIIERTGQRPLKLTGQLVHDIGLDDAVDDQTRLWRGYEVKLYRSEGGAWVGQATYLSTYDNRGEPRSFSDAVVADAQDKVLDWLQQWDPVSDRFFVGLPPDAREYEKRQEDQKRALRTMYADVLARLVASEEYAEEVP